MKATLRAVNAEKKFILDQNKKQLFEEGVDSRDRELAAYPPGYARFKARLNPNQVTDLNLTGRHYRGFDLDKGAFPKAIFSTAAISGKLIGRYGADIYGLTDESLKVVRDQRTNERILNAWAKFIKGV